MEMLSVHTKPHQRKRIGVRAAMQESDRVAEKGRKRKRILEAVKEVGEAKAQAEAEATEPGADGCVSGCDWMDGWMNRCGCVVGF